MSAPAQTFDKVVLQRADGTTADVGTLATYPDRLEFAGKKARLTFSNIRGVAPEDYRLSGGFQSMTRVRITYGAGDQLMTNYVSKVAMGLPKKVREANREFGVALQRTYGETQLSAGEQERIATVEAAVRQAKGGRGRRYMWIGAVLFLIGAVVTIATLGAASSGGGIYIVAYGPMLAGLALFLTGLVDYRRNRTPSA